MPTLSQLTKKGAVLKAVAEYERLGRDAFLAKNGFGRAKRWLLVLKGRQYDSKAMVGVALRYQLGKGLRSTDFSGGEASAVRRLRALGFRVIAREIADDTIRLPEEVPERFPEGLVRTIRVNRVERSPEARLKCIEAHGHRCAVCDIDFGETYGNAFEGLIHVHHVKPLARVKGRMRQVDPRRDLKPVCPNCHAAIHWGGRLRTIEQLKALLLGAKRAAV